MTDLEISRALALAIGWKPKSIDTHGTDSMWCYTGYKWHRFDYKDWNVIGPIAEKFDAFPLKSCMNNEWHSTCGGNTTSLVYADTPQKAIAMAVIGAKK